MWGWLKANTGKLAAAVAAVLAGVLLWGKWRRSTAGLRASVTLEKRLGEVRGLQAQRDALRAEAERAGRTRMDIADARLTLAIRDAKRRAVGAVEDVDGLSNGQVVERFNELLVD